MRIAVLEPDGSGGMLHFSHMLSEGLARNGHDVTLFTATDYELADLPRGFDVRPELALWPRAERRERQSNMRVQAATDLRRRSGRALRLSREMWRVAGAISDLSPDIVVVRPFPMPGHGAVLGRLKRSGATIVEVTHEFESRETSRRSIARLETGMSGVGSPLVDARLFMGEEIKQQYARLYPTYPRDRLFVIPHGDGELFRALADHDADLSSQYAIAPDAPVALLFGNLRPSKGIEDLLRAFAFADTPAGSRLLIAGHPSKDLNTEVLHDLAKTLGISSDVLFHLNYVPNEHVGPLFERARFLVLPYVTATQSGPLHVAMTFATPVIANRTGGIGDVVRHGETGLLVEPGDVAAFGEGLERLFSDDEMVSRMKQATARRAREHTWEVVAGALIDAAARVGSPA